MSDPHPADAASPNPGEIHLARAEARLGAKDYQAAYDDFLLAQAQLGEGDPRVSFGLSMTRMSLQEETRAQTQAARLRENPADVEAALKLADARRRNGKVKEALEAIVQAAGADPEDPRVHYELGLTLHCWSKDHDGALPHYDRALALKPDYVSALSYRAIARREAGRADLAIDDFSRLQELTPDTMLIHQNRAFAYVDLADFARAEADFSKVLEARPDQHFYLTQRGLCRLELRRYEEAIADFTEALALRQQEAMRWYDPEEDDEEPHDPDAEALRGRAEAHLHLGNSAAARADFTAAAEAFRLFGREADAQVMDLRAAQLSE
jgi:tetratricopeptide (TPR) repeat protein